MNRSFTVLRGFEISPRGDKTNVGTVLYTGVQGSLAETGHETFDPASSTQRTVRTFTCKMNNSADILTTDVLVDEFSGATYMIESLELEPGPGYYPQFKILTLRARSGVSFATDSAPGA